MPSSRLEITTLPSQQVERLEVQTMIFLLSCLFTGSLNPPNNDGNKEAIKKTLWLLQIRSVHTRHTSTGPDLFPMFSRCLGCSQNWLQHFHCLTKAECCAQVAALWSLGSLSGLHTKATWNRLPASPPLENQPDGKKKKKITILKTDTWHLHFGTQTHSVFIWEEDNGL